MGISFPLDLSKLAMKDQQMNFIVWLILLALTICSYLLLDNGVDVQSMPKEVLVSMVAAIKVVLILHYFMELNHAPALAKVIAYCWVLIVVFLIINMPTIADLLQQLA